MFLSIISELEELSDKLRDYVSDKDNPFAIVILFFVILAVFLLGYNAIHKND